MTSGKQSYHSESVDDTCAVAAELATTLRPGDVVLLSGDLGSGKTTFVRCACRALGVEGPVTSPTFTIGSVYRGSYEIAHLDMYRLAGAPDDVAALLDDYLSPERISFIEWPDAVELGELKPAARVTLEHAGGDARKLAVISR